MRYSIFFILVSVLFFSCNVENNAQSSAKKDSISEIIIPETFNDLSLIDSAEISLTFSPSGNYIAVKNKINTQRLRYFNELSDIRDSLKRDSIISDARQFFTKSLLNEIVPHWYGTVWDYNGYTNKPNEGVVACGYFVSTTLKHMGINVNRFKMAQQAGLNEAKTLEPKDSLLIYNVENTLELDSYFRKMKDELKDGLYFVGLSNHVGYIYVKNNELYFLHSNYIDGYVMIEKAEYSSAFRSTIYVIADITYNDSLILKWIKGGVFEVES